MALNGEPERNLASLFRAKHKLNPPVDTWVALGAIADVQTEEFPGTCDALLVRHATKRPKVLVRRSSTANRNRLRFTLAHELGHLVIPWQRGSMFCHTDMTTRVSDSLLRLIEAEANRFASELVIPTSWAISHIQTSSGELARRIDDVAGDAGVSQTVAVIAAERFCPPRTLVVQLDSRQTVMYASRSFGTVCPVPDRGTTFDVSNYDSQADVSVLSRDGKLLVAVAFPESAKVAPYVSGSAVVLLKRVVEDVGAVRGDGPALRSSIMGVTSHLNSVALRHSVPTPEQLLAAFRARFAGDPRYAQVSTHAVFEEYLNARAIELCRNAKRRSR